MAQISKILLIFLLPLSSFGAALEVDPAASMVSFLAVGKPSMMKIRGEGGKIQGKLDLAKKENLGELIVDLDAFDTGIAMRNQHMKEKYLETKSDEKKYAKLLVTKFDLPPALLKDGGKAEVPYTGKLKFHGEEQEISGTLSAEVKNDLLTGSTKLPLTLSKYKVEIPSYLGVKVAETVDVDISISGKISGLKK